MAARPTPSTPVAYFYTCLMESEHGVPAWTYPAHEVLAETGGLALSLIIVKKE